MSLVTLTRLGRTLMLAATAALITLPLPIFGQQLSLPNAPPPLMLAQADNSWMTPEERAKLGIKEEPKPKPQPKPNPQPQPQQMPRKDDDDTKDDDYEYNEYGTKASQARRSQGHYSSTEFIARDFIGYRARNSVLWALTFPGGGSFSVGRSGLGTMHFSIQVLPLLVSCIGYNIAKKNLEDKDKDKYKAYYTSNGEYISPPTSTNPTTLYIWLSALVATASKIWDAYGSYEYALEPNQ